MVSFVIIDMSATIGNNLYVNSTLKNYPEDNLLKAFLYGAKIFTLIKNKDMLKYIISLFKQNQMVLVAFFFLMAKYT